MSDRLKTNGRLKLKRFGFGLVASIGIYFAVSSIFPPTAATAAVIVLLTGNFL